MADINNSFNYIVMFLLSFPFDSTVTYGAGVLKLHEDIIDVNN